MIDRVPWVATAEARGGEERRVAAICDQPLVGVRYFEIVYGDRQPYWDGSDFHALDFGVELDLGTGHTWSFIWKQAGRNEGLLAFDGRLIGDQLISDGSFEIWDVAGHPLWQPLLGDSFTAVAAAWTQNPGADICPVTWVLTTAAGRAVVLTLGSRDTQGSFEGSADDVAVFFSLATAAEHGVLLP